MQNVFRRARPVAPYILAIGLGGFSNIALAHGGTNNDEQKNNLHASASVTYRDQSELNTGTIPGAMMGGEAYAPRDGANLDDAQLSLNWQQGEYFVYANVEAHDHGGQSELGIESLYFEFEVYGVNIKAGQFNSEVTELASWHGSRATYSQAHLMSDVFFGRHFSDVGFAVSKNWEFAKLGVEATNGNAWPASTSEQSISAYAHFNAAISKLNLNAGFWGMDSGALQRSDSRFDQGHNHGGVDSTIPISSEYTFSGDVQTLGVFAEAEFAFPSITLGLRVEEIHQESSGNLSRAAQSSGLESDYQGVNISTYMRYKNHSLHLSYEQIGLDNTFINAPSTLFINESGLFNNDFEPEQSKITYRLGFKNDFVLRLEAIDNKAYDPEGGTDFNIGLIWNKRFYIN